MPEEIVAKLRQVDVLTAQGQSIAEAVRTIAVTETTYFRWRAEYGGLKSDQVKRLKDLEPENARLRRAVSDLTLTSRSSPRPPGETSKPRPSPGNRGVSKRLPLTLDHPSGAGQRKVVRREMVRMQI